MIHSTRHVISGCGGSAFDPTLASCRVDALGRDASDALDHGDSRASPISRNPARHALTKILYS